jgi:protein-disulfide isomerase
MFRRRMFFGGVGATAGGVRFDFPPALFESEGANIMFHAPRPGNGVHLRDFEYRFRGESFSVTRRTLANAVGLAALFAIAPLPLIGGAMAQGGFAIRPVSLPDMALGPRNAPVTMVGYLSMTCSHCAAFMINAFPTLRSKYTEAGRVRFVFREFPLDITAAGASILARYIANGDSDLYFGAVVTLFKQQDQLIAQPVDTLQRVGRQFGMREEAVESCLKDQALLDKIAADQKVASEVVGIKATPTFVINGQINEGFVSFEVIDSKIASLLRK